MTDMERRTFCAALYHYGGQAQITMVFEEMAELQDVLCKSCAGAWTVTRAPTLPRRSPTSGSCSTRWRSSLRSRTRWRSSGPLRSGGCGKGSRTMPEYIDRERVFRAICGQRGPNRSPAQNRMLDSLMASVTCICAVDVAPVVRCKVCRSYNKPRVGWCEVHLDREHPDDFCSYGKYQTNGGADNA